MKNPSTTSISLDKRVFISASLIALIATSISLIWNLFLELPDVLNIAIGVFIMLYFLLFYYSRFKNKYSALLFVGISILFLSILYFFNGGINGSIPILYTVFIIVFISIAKSKHHRLILFITFLNLLALIIAENFYFEEFIVNYSNYETRELDIAFGYLSSIIICFFIVTLYKNSIVLKNEDLIKAKEEAEESEKGLKRAQQIAKLGSWHMDLKTSEVTWSEGLFKMYGLDPTLPVPPFSEHKKFFTAESWEILSKSLAKTKSTGIPYELELITVKEDGSNGWMWVHGEAVRNAQNEIIGLWGADQDITSKKKDEIVLRISEERRRTILKTTIDGFLVTDMKGAFLEVNDSYCRRSGYSEKELLKMNISDVEAIQTKEEILSTLQQIKRIGEIRFETKHITKDRNIFDVEVSVQYQTYDGGQCIIFIKDIEERKKSEKEKLLNERRQDALLQLNQMGNSSLDSIYSYTLEEAVELTESSFGFLGLVNDDNSIVSIYNWSGAAMNQCRVKDFGVEFEVEKAGIWGEVVRTGKPLLINNFNLPNPLKKGTPEGHVELESYLSIPVYSSKKIVAVVAVANKISEYIESDIKQLTILLEGMWKISQEHKAQNELKNALIKATESDRLKSAFLANMSHEIRTPMNGILGFTSLLKNPSLSGTEQQKYIDIIQKSGDRMLTTVNDIIDISRIESGLVELSVSEVNINDKLIELHSFFTPEAAKKGIQLVFKNDRVKRKVKCITDIIKFNSILTNLIKNAIKFTNQGTIEFGYKINEDSGSSKLEFYVKDSGIGIPKNRQKAIFDRFVQADIEDKLAHQGSGLGLTISKAYTEILGGEIWVESEEGFGSTFYFTIEYNPVTEPKSSTKNDEQILKKDEDSRKLKILVVEDDETAQYLLSIVVESVAKELLKVITGEEAVEAARANPDIDLILMDIKLPDMNGYEATRQIREFNKEVIIIAQTAHALTGDREKSIEAGCNDYITKPIEKEELLSLIAQYFYKM